MILPSKQTAAILTDKQLAEKSRFTILSLTAAIVLTLVLLFWLAYKSYDVYRITYTLIRQNNRLAELRGTISHLDEILTMSARMVAATGDMKWEERFSSFDPELTAAIIEIVSLTPETYSKEAAAETQTAHIKIEEMEMKAFALVKQHRLNEARAILFGQEYDAQTSIYSRGMADLAMQIRNSINTKLRSDEKRIFTNTAIVLVLISFSAGGWTIILRTMNRYRKVLLETSHELTRQTEELTALNANLDRNVVERSKDLEASRIAALNIMKDAVEARTKAEQMYKDLLQEITSRKQVEQALRESEERFRSVAETANDAIVSVGSQGHVTYFNKKAEEMFGYSAEEILGQAMILLMSEQFRNTYRDGVNRFLSTGGGHLIGRTFELIGLKNNGDEFPMELSLGSWNSKEETFFIGVVRDVTERKKMEERLRHLGLHDELTGLPKRCLFADRLEQAIARASWRKRVVAVLFLDLDRFKPVNDALGHHIGDHLLKAVAERLKTCVRDGDTVARIGGDEFIIILNDVARIEDVQPLVHKIRGAFFTPFLLEDRELAVTLSMGISLFPEDGPDLDTLVKKADTAMYQVKKKGGNNFKFYSDRTSKRRSRLLDSPDG